MLCRNHVDVSEGVHRCSRCGSPFCNDCLVHINGLPYCATCKQEQLLDVRSGVDRTMMTYAGIGKRFAAVLLDGLIVNLPIYLIIMGITFATTGPDGEPNLWVLPLWGLYILAAPVYESLMLAYKDGQTIGKSAMKIRVVRPDGSPLSTGQSWGRGFGKLLLGCLSIFDYLPAFFTKEKTTLHDMVASTRVIEIY